MIWFFAGVTVGLLVWALRDEFREDGSLHMRLSELVGDDHPDFDHLNPRDMPARPLDHAGIYELFEVDVPDDCEWSVDDVVRTYAEIASL